MDPGPPPGFPRVQKGKRMLEIVRRDAKGLEGKEAVPYGGKKMSAGDQTLPGVEEYHQMCVQSGCLESNSCL